MISQTLFMHSENLKVLHTIYFALLMKVQPKQETHLNRATFTRVVHLKRRTVQLSTTATEISKAFSEAALVSAKVEGSSVITADYKLIPQLNDTRGALILNFCKIAFVS